MEQEAARGQRHHGAEDEARSPRARPHQSPHGATLEVLDGLGAQAAEDAGVVQGQGDHGRPGAGAQQVEEQEGEDVLGDAAEEDGDEADRRRDRASRPRGGLGSAPELYARARA